MKGEGENWKGKCRNEFTVTSCPRSEFHGVVENREQCEGFESIISRSKERKIRAAGLLPVETAGPPNKGSRVEAGHCCLPRYQP